MTHKQSWARLSPRLGRTPTSSNAGTVRAIRTRNVSARAIEISGRELAPFGQGGSTVMFENIAAVEVAFVIKEVVDRGLFSPRSSGCKWMVDEIFCEGGADYDRFTQFRIRRIICKGCAFCIIHSET